MKEIRISLDHLFNKTTSTFQAMKDELAQNQHRLDYIDKAGAYLIAKSAPEDSVQIQSDVDHFHQVLEQVLSRLHSVHGNIQAPIGQIQGSPLHVSVVNMIYDVFGICSCSRFIP